MIAADRCERCGKPNSLCVCDAIRPVATKLHVLILQHPQEPGEPRGSARIAHLCLPDSTLKIGLSWPNLARALGREGQPSRWAVLYLGSARAEKPGLHFVSKKGEPVPAPAALDGIVVLDGTWSQAKAIWWRNAWLLKLRRAILVPARPSMYGDVRKEPRKEALSTIETIAESLDALGESPEAGKALRGAFAALLERTRRSR